MKTKYSGSSGIVFLFSLLLITASCNKENSASSTGASQAVVAATQSIAVAAGSTSSDSIYVVHVCNPGHHLDSIASGNLPAVITSYLSANYSGYTFQKAYTDKDSSGTISGYVVIIDFNGTPVGLKFDASGNFLKVLEQREGHDLTGDGWHEGGRFCDRDGRHKDTIQLALLPANVLSYFTTNYPQDTLVRAYITRDSSYMVFSVDNGAFITLFDSTGTFVKRVELQSHFNGNVSNVAAAALLSSIQSYLSATYPGYVFNQAFSFSENGIVAGYVVSIDANGSKYAIEFDDSGNFVRAITIR